MDEERVVQALELLAEKLDALEERVAKNESVLMDEIIGGITKLYDTNMRSNSVKEFRGKHGGLFEGVMEGFGA